jgi:hypothetical protein
MSKRSFAANFGELLLAWFAISLPAILGAIPATAQTTHMGVAVPANGADGVPFAVTVTALDASNHTVTSYGGTVKLSITGVFSDPPQHTFVPGDQGVYVFNVTIRTQGSHTLTASDFLGNNGNAMITIALTHFGVTVPANVVAGVPFSVTVTALDGSNNVVTGYGDVVAFSTADAGAILPATGPLANGTATLIYTPGTVGTQFVNVGDPVQDTDIFGGAQYTVSAGPVSHLRVRVPATTPAGASLNGSVAALDAMNNPVASYNGTVHFTSSDGAATLPSDFALTNGTGAFSATLETAGSQTITVNDAATHSIQGIGYTVVPGVATHFSLGAPAHSITGSAVHVVVRPLDAFNNVVAAYNGTVHFTSSDNAAILPGSYAFVAADKGAHTFTVTFNTNGGETLTVSDLGNAITGNSVTTVGATSGCFIEPATNYSAGPDPISITVGDWNGDGKTDLAVANQGGPDRVVNPVTTFLGNGNGTFQAAAPFPAGLYLFDVVAGDFNGDGKQDLAATSYDPYSDKVNILLGNGDGTFQAPSGYRVGGVANRLTVGDFNRDGKEDLAVVNQSTSSVSILLGNGDGSFQTATQYPVNSGGNPNPYSVAAGDLNGDGNVDLVVANYLGGSGGYGSISVLLGNGDGTFAAATSYSLGTGSALGPIYVALSDFNGDGKLDVAVANSQANSVGILLGQGDGTFQPPVNYPTGSVPYSIAIADFNNDGKIDIAVANSQSNSAGVLLGNGDGTFQPVANFSGGGPNTLSIAAGDFNGDGTIDLALANESFLSGTISVLLNHTCPGPATHFNVTAPATVTSGVSFAFSVTALDQFNVVATAYTGTSHFTSTDGSASLPADYVFVLGDHGMHTFTNLATLRTPGTQTLTATDTIITGVSGNITVDPASTLTVISSSANPAVFRQRITFTATVSSIGGTPTGSVTFMDGATVLGVGGLSNGVATLGTSLGPIGKHSITASYAANGGFMASTSSPLIQYRSPKPR